MEVNSDGREDDYGVATIVEEITAQCIRTPDAIAGAGGEQLLSYRDLDERSTALAKTLVAAGAGKGRFVALLLPRSPDLLIAMLAVAKSGSAYLPIDPDYPTQRIAHVLSDSDAAVVLTRLDLRSKVTSSRATILLMDDLSVAECEESLPKMQLEDPFYLIYTSGSTGQPKGAVLPLRGPLNQCRHYIRFVELSFASRVLIFTSPGFDMTQCNVWATLMAGGTVVMSESAIYDPANLLDLIAGERITHINCTPSAFFPLLDSADQHTWEKLASLRFLALGGESINLSRLAAWRASPGFACTVVNSYGPTECSAKVAMHKLAPAETAPEALPVGHPIDNIQIHVLDAELKPIPDGEEGELCVTGVGVGNGYLNRPELTAERFRRNPFGDGLLYCTGDRARLRQDGLFEVLGRLDRQVKVRGVRMELEEIEILLATHPAVRDAAMAVHGDRLCAYPVLREGSASTAHDLREFLAAKLPDAMVPSVWTFLDRLPLNPHGKLDRRALPAPSQERPPLAVAYAAPRGAFEIWLATQVGELLGCSAIGRDDPFFELGGDSLAAVRLVGQVGRKLRRPLPVVGFFAAPTVAGYAAHLLLEQADAVMTVFGTSQTAASSRKRSARRNHGPKGGVREDIAIVGMSVRLPGADDPDTFWNNLKDGVESIRLLSDAELDAAGVSAELRADPSYVRAAATLSHPDCFDAAFFGYSPREAALMDPQQRLLLECAWSALEHAGHDPASAGHVGVFAGVARNSYFQHQLANNPQTRPQLPEVQVTFGNDKDYAATRVSFRLNLTGPAFTAQTACSTGGVLVHLARQSLLNHECDAAIVGGSRVVCPLNAGYLWVDGSIMSRDGRMRAFDAEGSGMIRGSGATCVVLKRRSDAERDGDTIYALIKGSALNNDGSDKAGYAAPSVGGQTEVIELALEDAGVSADTIGYVEAHGTSTHLGDPIEIAALTRAFRRDSTRIGHCRIGSVKSNVGHLDPAAGIASLVKTALMLHNRAIAPSVGFERPNPNIDFASSPFRVADRHEPWNDEIRRAGVSAFGIGGTNAHLVLEEAPRAIAKPSSRNWQLMPLSAKTDAALAEAATRHVRWLSAQPEVDLASAAWTLQTGRAGLEHRGFAVLRDAAQAEQAFSTGRFVRGRALPAARLVFVFPGQGAQHPGMGRELYDCEPLYRSVIDEGCEILAPLLGLDLRSILYPKPAEAPAAADRLRQTVLAQPAIFLVSYALARLWMSVGLQPSSMVGHSVGEFVAATLAGVFEFRDALGLLAARARLMQSMPSGSMLAVRLAETATRELLPAGLSLAALNAPQLCVVSGPTPAVDALESQLGERGVGAVRLHTSHAFHSPMMDPIVDVFAREVARVPRRAPTLPITSTLTGALMTAEEAQDPHYWSRQLREAVRFAPAIATTLSEPGAVLLEVGPGQALSGPLRQIGAATAPGGSVVVSSSPPAAQEDSSAIEHFMLALGRLWIAGLNPDWAAVHGGARQRIGLPTYAFARTRHWVEATLLSRQDQTASTASAIESPAIVAQVAVAAPGAADAVRDRAVQILGELTGMNFSLEDDDRSFLELGMDSLLLTQVAGRLKNAFRLDLRFRQLLEEFNTVGKLVGHLREQGSLDMPAAIPAARGAEADVGDSGDVPRKSFGAGTRISKEADALSPSQRRALDRLTARYIARTSRSKAYTQQHRRHLADPRTVSGFKPMWKEIIYPIVSTRSDGAYLWDVDGHRYIDTVNGFGATLFGHRPAFVNEAVKAQLDRGYEIGPIQDFIGDCASRFTQMVKLDRVTFCNTGSEAVSAAQRCARTVTGRDLIVSFVNDYHGVHDEVIVRRGPGGRGLPAASGIPAAHTSQTLILDYGDPKSLDVIRSRASEIAAVMVEPIQSRNQSLQPRDFLHALREFCTQADCAFIMDEVITGFRLAPGGAQEHFGVKADLASYGKVFGGGMPIGAVAGIPRYMDALDGGWWQFGDSSVPEAGVTYFAGTFVRHPLAMAAVGACLQHLEAHPDLQREMNARTLGLVERLRAAFAERLAPLKVSTYASIFRFEFTQDEPFGELLAHYFRERGVHTYDHRNQVMTTCHDEAVMETLFQAYIGAVDEMQRDGLLGRIGSPASMGLADKRPGARWYDPPVAGARLGRTTDGTPAWFIEDSTRTGKFLQLID